MKKAIIVLSATLVLLLSIIFHPAQAVQPQTCTINWDGLEDNINWEKPSNWDKNHVPFADDDVCIASDITDAIVLSSGNQSIKSLSSNRPVRLDGGSLSIANDSTVDATLSLNGGTLGGAGKLSLNGKLVLQSGTLLGPGETDVNGILQIGGPSDKLLDNRILIVNGDASWGEGNIRLSNGALIQNAGNFSIQMLDTYTLSSSGTIGFTNQGAVTKNLGGTVQFQAPFVNRGTVAVDAGTLRLANGGSWDYVAGLAPFTVASGATLDFAGGSFSVSTNNVLTIDGMGTVQVGGGQVNVSPRHIVSPTLEIADGAANFSNGLDARGGVRVNGGALSVVGGLSATGIAQVGAGTATLSGAIVADSLSVTGGTANFAGNYQMTDGTVSIAGGTASFQANGTVYGVNLSNGVLTGTGTVTAIGPITWTGGTMGGSGRTVASGGMQLGNGTMTLSGRGLANTGTATWTGGSIVANSGAVLTNTGTFDIRFDGSLSAGDWTFVNTGTVKKSAGTGTSTFSVPFNNDGAAQALSGKLLVNGGGTSGGSFSAGSGATLEFGDSHSLLASSSVSGAGTVRFSGSSSNTTIAGTYGVTGATEVAGGTANFSGTVAGAGQTFTVSGGTANLMGDVTDIGQSVTVSGGTANFSGGRPVTPQSLIVSSGTLTGTDVVRASGNINWTGGTMGGSGLTVVNGAMEISGSATKNISGRTLVNSGTVNWKAGNITGSDGALVNNLGTFDIRTNSTLGGNATVFSNQGTVTKSAGTGTTTIDITFNNGDTVQALSGKLLIGGGGSSTGAFSAGPGATLEFGSSHSMLASSSVSGDGTVRFSGSGSNTTIAGSYGVTGTSAVTGGTVSFSGTVTDLGQAVTISGGTANFTGSVTDAGDMLTISGGTANFSTGGSIVPQEIILSSGMLTGTDTVRAGGNITWTGGTMAGPGSTVVGTILDISGSGTKYLTGRSLVNNGTATWRGGNITGSAGAVLTNTGTFDIRADSTFSGSTATFANAGTVKKSMGTGTTTFSVPFDNNGAAQVQTSKVLLSGGGTSGGSFSAAQGATLEFGSSHSLLASSSVSGDGTVRFSGSSSNTTIGGTHAVTGTTDVTAGTASFTGTVSSDGQAFVVSGGTANFSGTVTDLGQAVTISGGTANFTGSVTDVGDALTISGGAANFSTGGSITLQEFILNSGTLTGTDTVRAGGNVSWTGGTMAGPGSTVVGTILDISGSGTKYLTGRSLVNNGTATWNGGDIVGSGTAVVTNTATFDIRTDNTVSGGTGATFANAGTLTKSAGTGVSTLGVSFYNTGTVQALASKLLISGDGSSGGDFSAADGATLDFGGSHSLLPSSNVGGAGTVRFSGTSSATSIGGTYGVAGTTEVAAGSASFTGTLTGIGRVLNVYGGTANFSSGEPITPVTLSIAAGTVTGTDTITATGYFTWSGGMLAGSAPAVADLGMELSGLGKTLNGRTLINNGTATWTGGNVSASNGAVVTNRGLFDVRTGNALSGSAATFANPGTVIKSDGGIATISVPFDNNGRVEVLTGALYLQSGGTGAGSFSSASGATLGLGGSYSLDPASGVSGAGTISLTGVDVAGTYNVTGTTQVGSGTANFTGLVTSIGQALTVSSGTANFNSGEPIVPVTLTLSSGTITGTDPITATGYFTWSGGTLGGTAPTVASGTMEIGGSVTKFLTGHTLLNSGAARWLTGTISGSQGAVLSNTGTLDIRADSTFSGSATTFENAGTITKSAASGTTTFSVPFNNAGTTRVQAGKLLVNGGGTGGGAFSAAQGATLEFGSTYAMQADSIVDGDGTVRFSGSSSTASIGGTYGVAGTTEVTGGTASFTGILANLGQSLRITAGTANFTGVATGGAGTVAIGGGTANFSTDDPIRAVTLALTSGTITGTGTIAVSGYITWTGGTQSGSGATISGGSMDIDSTSSKTLSGRSLVNNGTATWMNGTISASSGAVLTNTGTLEIRSNRSFGSSSATFANLGTVSKSVLNGTTTINSVFDNSGRTEVLAGTMLFTGGGTGVGSFYTADGATLRLNNGTYSLQPGSGVTAAGSIRIEYGTVNISGTYDVAGTTSFLGGTVNFGSVPTRVNGSNVLQIEGSTVNFSSGGLPSFSGLILTAGTLGGSDTVIVNGPTTWSGGTMSGAGQTVANGDMDISGTSTKYVTSRTVVNNSAATWNGGTIDVSSGGVLSNTGAFDIRTDTRYQGGYSSFVNNGTLVKSAGSGTSELYGFLNIGTMRVLTGTLNVDNDGVHGGTITVAEGAALGLSDWRDTRTHTIGPDALLSGGGTVRFWDYATVAGTYAVTGTTVVWATVDFSSGHPVTLGALSLGGALTGTDPITATGTITWSSGTMNGSGQIVADGGMTISGGNHYLDRTLVNNGVATWTGGNIYGRSSGHLDNVGTLDIRTDSYLYGDPELWTIDNTGTIRKSAGTGWTTMDSWTALNNDGIVEVMTGTLRSLGGGASGGSFSAAKGATLYLTAGQELKPASIVTGEGTISLGRVDVGGTYSVTGTTEVKGASIDIYGLPVYSTGTANFTGTVVSVGEALSINGGMANFSSGEAITPVTLTLTSSFSPPGVLTGTDTITATGLLSWQDGRIGGTGPSVNAGGVLLNGNGSKVLDGRGLVNYGAATWSYGNLTTSNGAVITNAGTLDLRGDWGTTYGGGAQSTFVNTGVLTKSIGTTSGSSHFVGTFDNFGTASIVSGTLWLDALANYSGWTLQGGTYNIAGTLKFPNSGISYDAANVVLDGPAARIVNTSNVDAFTGGLPYMLNSVGSDSSLTLLNGRQMQIFYFTNYGNVTIGAGSVITASTYTQSDGQTTLNGGTLYSPQTVRVQQGTLNGSGKVSGNLYSAARVAPGSSPGRITVTGDYTQSSAGALDVDIGGPTAGTDFDQLSVAGRASLDGTLNVSLFGDFQPGLDSTYPILPYGSRYGSFATMNGLNIGGGKQFLSVYGSQGLTLTTAAGADLSVAQADGPDPAFVGNTLTYTITVTNNGSAVAYGARLTDTLPASVVLAGATPSTGACSGTSTVTCNLGDLGAGTSATVTAVVSPTVSSIITNTVVVGATVSDLNPADNTAVETTTISPADLAVAITDYPDPARTGNPLTYTVTVTNIGPALATNVRITDALPAEVALGSATATQGTCEGTGTVTCYLGSLAVGSVATATIVVTPTMPTTFDNSVSVAGGEVDPTMGNNTATATTVAQLDASGHDFRDVGKVRVWANQFTQAGGTSTASGDVVVGQAVTGDQNSLKLFAISESASWNDIAGPVTLSGTLAFYPEGPAFGRGRFTVDADSGAVTWDSASVALITRLGSSNLTITPTFTVNVLQPVITGTAEIAVSLPENPSLHTNVEFRLGGGPGPGIVTGTATTPLAMMMGGGILSADVQASNDGLVAPVAHYRLPGAAGTITTTNLLIDGWGESKLHLGDGGSFPLSDLDLGNGVFTLQELTGTLGITDSVVPGYFSYDIALSGTLRVANLPTNPEIRSGATGLRIANGALTGRVGDFDLGVAGQQLRLQDVRLQPGAGSGYELLSARPVLQMPEAWSSPGVTPTTTLQSMAVMTTQPYLRIAGSDGPEFTIPQSYYLGGDAASSPAQFGQLRGGFQYVPAEAAWHIQYTSTVTFTFGTDSSRVDDVAFTVRDGHVDAQLSDAQLRLAGLPITAPTLAYADGGFHTSQISLTLPSSWGGDEISVPGLVITGTGVQLGGGQFSIPSRSLGETVVLSNTVGAVTVDRGGSPVRYAIAVTSTVAFNLGEDSSTVDGVRMTIASGRVDGELRNASLALAGLPIMTDSLLYQDDRFSAGQITLTLPSSWGASQISVPGLLITQTGVLLGDGEFSITPDQSFGETARLSGIRAALAVDRATSPVRYSIAVTSTLTFNFGEDISPLPDAVRLTIARGKVTGLTQNVHLTLAGLAITAETVSYGDASFSTGPISLTLPSAWGGEQISAPGMLITKDGVKFGSGEFSIPSRSLGETVVLSNTVGAVTVDRGGSPVQYAIAVTSTVAFNLGEDSSTVDGVHLTIANGRVSGELPDVSLALAGLPITVDRLLYQDDSFAASQITMTLPSSWGASQVSVPGLLITQTGVLLGDGEFSVTPDQSFGNTIGLSNIRAAVMPHRATTPVTYSIALTSTLTFNLGEDTSPDNVANLTIANGRATGELQNVHLTLAGLAVIADTVSYDDAGFTTSPISLTLPSSWGGNQVSAPRLRITQTDVHFVNMVFGNLMSVGEFSITPGQTFGDNVSLSNIRAALVPAGATTPVTYSIAVTSTMNFHFGTDSRTLPDDVRLTIAHGRVDGELRNATLAIAGLPITATSMFYQDDRLVASQITMTLPSSWDAHQVSVPGLLITRTGVLLGGGEFSITPDQSSGDTVSFSNMRAALASFNLFGNKMYAIAVTSTLTFNFGTDVTPVDDVRLTIANGEVTGDLGRIDNLRLAGLGIGVDTLHYQDTYFSTNWMTLTLPSSWGGNQVVLPGPYITRNGVRFGDGQVRITPDQSFGETVDLRNIWVAVNRTTAPISYSIVVTANLTFNFGEDSRTLPGQRLTIANGRVTGEMQDASLTLAGLPLTADRLSYQDDSFVASQVTMTLPTAWDAAQVSVPGGLRIITSGVQLGNGQFSITPDQHFGETLTYSNTRASLVVDRTANPITYSIAVTTNVTFNFGEDVRTFNDRHLTIVGGKLTGEMRNMSLALAGLPLAADRLTYDSYGRLAAAQASLTLPSSWGGGQMDVPGGLLIAGDRPELGGGEFSVPIPQVGAFAEFSNTRAAIAVHRPTTGITYSIAIASDLTFTFGDESEVNRGVNLSISRGQVSGQVDNARLKLAGRTLVADSLAYDGDEFDAASATLTLPREWNSVEAPISGLRVSEAGISLGGGQVGLPNVNLGRALRLSDMTASVQVNGGQYSLVVNGTANVLDHGGLELLGNSPDLHVTIDKNGVSGTVDGFTIKLLGLRFEFSPNPLNQARTQPQFLGDRISIGTGSVALPPTMGDARGSVHGILIAPDGLVVGSANIRGSGFPLPDFTMAMINVSQTYATIGTAGDNYTLDARATFDFYQFTMKGGFKIKNDPAHDSFKLEGVQMAFYGTPPTPPAVPLFGGLMWITSIGGGFDLDTGSLRIFFNHARAETWPSFFLDTPLLTVEAELIVTTDPFSIELDGEGRLLGYQIQNVRVFVGESGIEISSSHFEIIGVIRGDFLAGFGFDSDNEATFYFRDGFEFFVPAHIIGNWPKHATPILGYDVIGGKYWEPGSTGRKIWGIGGGIPTPFYDLSAWLTVAPDWGIDWLADLDEYFPVRVAGVCVGPWDQCGSGMANPLDGELRATYEVTVTMPTANLTVVESYTDTNWIAPLELQVTSPNNVPFTKTLTFQDEESKVRAYRIEFADPVSALGKWTLGTQEGNSLNILAPKPKPVVQSFAASAAGHDLVPAEQKPSEMTVIAAGSPFELSWQAVGERPGLSVQVFAQNAIGARLPITEQVSLDATSLSDTAIWAEAVPSGVYTLTVIADDLHHNGTFARLEPVLITDTTAPRPPLNLQAQATADGSVLLTWDSSAAEADVKGYQFAVDGRSIGRFDGRVDRHQVSGLELGVTHDLSAAAYDLSNNLGQPATATLGLPTFTMSYVSPSPGDVITRGRDVRAAYNQPITLTGLSLVDAAGSTVAGTVAPVTAEVSLTHTAVYGGLFTPTSVPLPAGVYTATITGAQAEVGSPVSASWSFTVLPDLDYATAPPTVADLRARSTLEDTPLGSIPFTVSDLDTDPATLTVTATSSDEALVPAANITLGGTGQSRTLSATPAADQFGGVTITVTAADATHSGGQSFRLTVNPVNDPPSFRKGSDVVVQENIGAQRVAGWAKDISPGASNEVTQTLTFSVTVDIPGLFAAPPSIEAATGDLTFTPAPNAHGRAMVTVALRDDGGMVNGGQDISSTQTFAISIEETSTSYRVFLPLAVANHAIAPDLVVERIAATSQGIAVTIRNQGQATVIDDFWVDVYVNPREAPRRVNQTWDQVSDQGLVWGVTAPSLPPGGTLTLTVGDAYFWPSLSRVSWPMAVGASVYAQADSASTSTAYGGVLESHEVTGAAYNNIASTTVRTGAAMPAAVEPGGLGLAGSLPPRP